jgi:hypothetical protein
LEYYAEDAYQPFCPTEERRWVQEKRHLLHNTPKIQSIGVYTINQLTGLWICVLGRSYEGLVFLVVTMKHDAWSTNYAVLVQVVHIFLPAISSDGRKKMGLRDKFKDVMSGWPSTGWSGKPRIPDSIFVTRATTKRK